MSKAPAQSPAWPGLPPGCRCGSRQGGQPRLPGKAAAAARAAASAPAKSRRDSRSATRLLIRSTRKARESGVAAELVVVGAEPRRLGEAARALEHGGPVVRMRPTRSLLADRPAVAVAARGDVGVAGGAAEGVLELLLVARVEAVGIGRLDVDAATVDDEACRRRGRKSSRPRPRGPGSRAASM